jgi:membrane protein implicated in regulation of membrane protease activity
MRRDRTLLLGALSVLPALYMAFFMVLVGISAFDNGGKLLIPFGVLMALHLSAMVLIIVLLVVFIRDAYRSPRVDDNKRAFWAIVLFLGNAIAFPIYWWVYMRQPAGRPSGTPHRPADAAR